MYKSLILIKYISTALLKSKLPVLFLFLQQYTRLERKLRWQFWSKFPKVLMSFYLEVQNNLLRQEKCAVHLDVFIFDI